ncbi:MULTISPECIES: HAD-IA family hydrolase [Pseudoalteromonas]|uniref:HAD family hydrolase n=1 Tax=Pseudoalteromonas TaxID=53246 RepID=UPI001109114A|nr:MULTISPECIES: HAD-IA family hydrolase [Pseudoalteromonas]NKC20992.1 HAD-IA family hydrolase [Pseudoalteromonas galatheae]TMN40534.1 phosphatase [Pseudoalteromonas sp. S2755]
MDRIPVKGIIFDLDGTLVTSELDFSLIRAQIGCPVGQDLLSFISALPSPYMREEAMNIVHQHELCDAQHCDVIPGVKECIAQLSRMGIPLAVVTRNFAKAARLKLKTAGLPIPLILTRDDAPAKPDPAALLQVAQTWQVPPYQCVYVGDYLYDIEAAHNANMPSCLFAPNDKPHYAEQADVVISHFAELVDALYTLDMRRHRYLA